MKRGQMEVVGLLVIVILLLVIGLLVLRFSVRSNSSGATIDARSSLESTRLLQALSLTTIQGKSFQDSVVDCSHDAADCQTLRHEIESIFSVTLKKGQKYSFYLVEEDQKLITIEQCPVGVLSSYPFSTAGGFYEAQLRLCTPTS